MSRIPVRALESTTAQERLVFGARHSLYSFPTEDLCDFLRARIQGKTAIEISARRARKSALHSCYRQQPARGGGGQCALLADWATDRALGGACEKLDAVAAVQEYRPNVVIAC